MSIFINWQPLPKNQIQRAACPTCSYVVAKSSLSMPSLALLPSGADWWLITLYTTGLLYLLRPSLHGFTLIAITGGSAKENSNAYLPFLHSSLTDSANVLELN